MEKEYIVYIIYLDQNHPTIAVAMICPIMKYPKNTTIRIPKQQQSFMQQLLYKFGPILT